MFGVGGSLTIPGATTVQVQVKDGDSATATNAHTVNWHLPLEKNENLGATKTKRKIRTLAGPVYRGLGTIKSRDPGGDMPFSAVIDGASAVLDLTGDPEAAGMLDILAKITDITDWKYSNGGDNTQSLVTNDDNEWSLGNSDSQETAYTGPADVPSSLLNYPDGQNLCYLDWCVVEKDTDASWYADGYNHNGYDGNSMHTVNVHKVDLIEGQPFFTQYKNPDGSPYTG